MRCHPSGQEVGARQASTEPPHRIRAVDADIVEARIVAQRRGQGEPAGEGTAADVDDDGIDRPRVVEELAERRDEFLQMPSLVQMGIKQGQIVRSQVTALGVEIGLTAGERL